MMAEKVKTLKIGQVAKKVEVNVETIRYYQRRGLVSQPPKKASGHREYSQEDVSRIRFIKRAQGLGFTLNEISELLELRVDSDRTCDQVRKKANAKVDDIEDRVQTLQAMKQALSKLIALCSGRGPTSECPILEALEDDSGSSA